MPPVSMTSNAFRISRDSREPLTQTAPAGERRGWFRRLCSGSGKKTEIKSSPSLVPNQGDSCDAGCAEREALQKTSSTEMCDDGVYGGAESVVPDQPLAFGESSSSTGAELHFVQGVAYTQIKRNRPVNEDTYCIESRKLINGAHISLIGVFDGHGNEDVSRSLSETFPDIFYRVSRILHNSFTASSPGECLSFTRKLFPSESSYQSRHSRILSLNCPDSITLSLCVALAICDERAMMAYEIDTAHGGATATVVAVVSSGIYIAQIGDSSACIIGYNESEKSVVLRTSDHRPDIRPDERARVIQAGGRIYKGNSVGMAFSSLNVTRSVGDTLWRSNGDWGRDNTKERHPPDIPIRERKNAIDEGLSEFSRKNGCVGIISDPEWYACTVRGDPDHLLWDIRSNTGDSRLEEVLDGMLVFPETYKFLLLVGSDGFWETSAFTNIVNGNVHEPEGIVEMTQSEIGTNPHDDSTLVVASLNVTRTLEGATTTPPQPIKRRHRSLTCDNHNTHSSNTLDSLFS
jgi:serine/threonine protein phosphatase PrpC